MHLDVSLTHPRSQAMPIDHLDPLLERWEDAMSTGIDLPVGELCPDDPTLADTLAQHIETLRWIRRALLDLGAPTGPVHLWKPWELA